MVTAGRGHEGGGMMAFGLGRGGDDEICSGDRALWKGRNGDGAGFDLD